MPGRLEFEHEVDNEAEMAVKDMEFGLVYKYGGDRQPAAQVTGTAEDGEEEAVEATQKEIDGAGAEENKGDKPVVDEDVKIKEEPMENQPEASGSHHSSPGSSDKEDVKPSSSRKGKGKAVIDQSNEVEDEDELEIKLAMLDIYFTKLDKREEAKEIIFDRSLTEHKRVCYLCGSMTQLRNQILANDRKRPKDERELIQRYKVFAKMQTAQDFEILIEGLICKLTTELRRTATEHSVDEQNLRKRIAELQEYRRMGITTGAEAEAYDNAKAARVRYYVLQLAYSVGWVSTGHTSGKGSHTPIWRSCQCWSASLPPWCDGDTSSIGSKVPGQQRTYASDPWARQKAS